MEFALSQDQRLLQQTIDAFVAQNVPLDSVRQAADGDAAAAQTIATGLSELGLSAMLVPEDHGGLGLGLVEAVVIQEALGRSVAPAGFLGAALAAIGIAATGSDEQKAEYLPALAAGEMRFATALTEHAGARDDAGVRADGDRLSGTALFVLDTARATHVLIADTQGTLHIAPLDADGVEQAMLGTIDGTRDYAELRFSDAIVNPLTAENQPGFSADRMIAAARVILAAASLGAAQHMLDEAVSYAGQREQFGRAIATFQAVKHLCAEMAAKIEPSRALVWHAAYAFNSQDPEALIMACLAKSHLAEVGDFVARTATEVHGGMGFTDLLGLHFWFKRIGANRQLFGGPEKTRADAARLQGWGG